MRPSPFRRDRILRDATCVALGALIVAKADEHGWGESLLVVGALWLFVATAGVVVVWMDSAKEKLTNWLDRRFAAKQ